MSGVVERAIRLRGLVVLTLQREKLLNESGALNGRVGQLEGWQQSLRGLVPASHALKSAGSPSTTLDDVAGLRRSAERALQDFRRDPTTVRHPEADAANIFWGQASRKIGMIEATIRSEWRDHVNGTMPDYQPAVVRALAGAEADTVEVNLAQSSRRAAAMADRLPANEEEAAQVAALASQIRTLLRRFDLSGEPAEVRAFVEAALADRATIDLLTDTVRDWLVRRGIDRNVRLSFATTR